MWHMLILEGRRNVLTGSEADKVSNVQKTKSKSNRQDQEGRADKVG